MTAFYSNRLRFCWYFLQVMRICKSSIVWWKARELKADILLIYKQNRKKSWTVKRNNDFHLFVSMKPFEKYSIYKLKLFTDLFKYDENNQNFLQYILFLNHFWMRNSSWFNYSKPNLELQQLLWLFQYNSRRNLIQANSWLIMKSRFIHTKHKNKTYSSYVRRNKQLDCK